MNTVLKLIAYYKQGCTIYSYSYTNANQPKLVLTFFFLYFFFHWLIFSCSIFSNFIDFFEYKYNRMASLTMTRYLHTQEIYYIVRGDALRNLPRKSTTPAGNQRHKTTRITTKKQSLAHTFVGCTNVPNFLNSNTQVLSRNIPGLIVFIFSNKQPLTP